MRAGEGLPDIHGGRRQAALHRSLTITGAGLTLGAGTVLARMTIEGSSHLAIDGEEERILALLSVAFDKSISANAIGNLRRASEQWSRGDKCLAHIHLAHAGLPQLDKEGAARLALAGKVLAKGFSPRALLKVFGLLRAADDALRFNPNQPRVPAGSGRESGAGHPAMAAPVRAPGSLRSPKSNMKASTPREIPRTIFMRKGAPSEPRRPAKMSGTGVRSALCRRQLFHSRGRSRNQC